jgi:hypothetical protein
MKNYILAKPLLLIEQEEEKDPARLEDLKNLLDMENKLNASDGKEEGDAGYLSLADSLELGAGVSKLANELGIKASSGEDEFIPEIEAAIKEEGETPPKRAAEDPPGLPDYDPKPIPWIKIIEWVASRVLKGLDLSDPEFFGKDFKEWRNAADVVLESPEFEDWLVSEEWFDPKEKGLVDKTVQQAIELIREYGADAFATLMVATPVLTGFRLGYRAFGGAAEKASAAALKRLPARIFDTIKGEVLGLFTSDTKWWQKVFKGTKIALNLINKGSWSSAIVAGLLTKGAATVAGKITPNWAKALGAAIKQLAKNKRLKKEAFEKLTPAQKIEKMLVEALDEGDFEKAVKYAKDALNAGVLPEDIRVKIKAPSLTPLYKGAEQVWTFVFKDVVGGMKKEVSIPQRVLFEVSEEWKKVLKLAGTVIGGGKRGGKLPLPESIQEQSEDQIGVNALKGLAAKISAMTGGEDKLKELMESEGMEDIARFFVEKALLEEYIKMLDAQDKELEKFISMMEGEIEKAKAEEKASAGQQTSPDAPATAEPQTQTPVNERKIKVSKSKLIDIISEQLKEQNEQIDIDHDELFALVAQEAFKQINRKK